MARIADRLKQALIFIHRWMGVVFCLLFLLWFTSGIAMMYWSYPEVSRADRLRRSPALRASEIRLSPEEALARLGSGFEPRQVRLAMFDDRPAYRFRLGFADSIVYADDGSQQGECAPEMTLRIASAWTAQPPAEARVTELDEEDQWTVSGEFADLRPLRKYSWPDGEQAYVSTVTCEVVQYTTRASRIGAYFGAIPHWLYFTPLRKNGANWSRVVIWASGLATVAALLGVVIAVSTYSPLKRYRYAQRPSSIPYVGQKRWHMMFGLVFGPLACTWAFSGMLSMDPFPEWQSGNSDETDIRIEQALSGSPPLSAFSAKSPGEVLRELGSDFTAKELQLTSLAESPVYIATASAGRARAAPEQTRIVPVHGDPQIAFDSGSIVETLRQAARPHELSRVRQVTQYEAYYLDRRNRLPLPVIFVQLNDPARSMYYVDPKTARVVASYNANSRWNRWLYHGLHSLDLPWLYKYRPAWDIVVLALLVGCASLSITSLILAWRVLRRSL